MQISTCSPDDNGPLFLLRPVPLSTARDRSRTALFLSSDRRNKGAMAFGQVFLAAPERWDDSVDSPAEEPEETASDPLLFPEPKVV